MAVKPNTPLANIPGGNVPNTPPNNVAAKGLRGNGTSPAPVHQSGFGHPNFPLPHLPRGRSMRSK